MREAVLAALAAVLMLVVHLLPAGAPGGTLEFRRSAAGIHGRIQMLRQLEKGLFACFASPQRAVWYLARRQQARAEIDELMARAQSAAQGPAERHQLEQLAKLVRVADQRFSRLKAG